MFGWKFDKIKEALTERELALKQESDSWEAHRQKEENEIRFLRSQLDKDKKDFESQKGQVYKSMELEFKEKLMDATEKVRKEYDTKLRDAMEENFNKLKESLVNLHEEGNANTKYLEKMTLKMMEAVRPPTQQIELTTQKDG